MLVVIKVFLVEVAQLTTPTSLSLAVRNPVTSLGSLLLHDKLYATLLLLIHELSGTISTYQRLAVVSATVSF